MPTYTYLLADINAAHPASTGKAGWFSTSDIQALAAHWKYAVTEPGYRLLNLTVDGIHTNVSVTSLGKEVGPGDNYAHFLLRVGGEEARVKIPVKHCEHFFRPDDEDEDTLVDYGTGHLETDALLAALEDDQAACVVILRTLQPDEVLRLEWAAEQLAAKCRRVRGVPEEGR